MTDYLTQCNAIAAEKKVWRWAKYMSPFTSAFTCRREDDTYFLPHRTSYARTEYDGDADGNPIQAMLGPQELWDKYKIRVMVGVNGSWLVDRVEDGIYCVRLAEMIDTYASAIAEANRIAGGGA